MKIKKLVFLYLAQIMKSIYTIQGLFMILFFAITHKSVTATPADSRLFVGTPTGDPSIMTAVGSPVVILTMVQSILLKVVIPVIVVGASLYIAYELFTAEGDESRMKKAWKSVAYTAVALIAIALSYAIVSIVTKLSF